MLRHVRQGLQAAPGIVQRDLHRQGPLRVRVPEHGQLPRHAAAQHPALLPRRVPRLGLLACWQLGKRKFSDFFFFNQKKLEQTYLYVCLFCYTGGTFLRFGRGMLKSCVDEHTKRRGVL